MLPIGDKFPDFCLRDQDGKSRTRDDLLDRFTVILFFQRNESPSCVKELCNLRDMLKSISSRLCQVVAISQDGISSQKNFAEKNHLNFYLLADEQKILTKKCASLKEKEIFGSKVSEVVSTTYITDTNGFVLWSGRDAKIEEIATILKKFLYS